MRPRADVRDRPQPPPGVLGVARAGRPGRWPPRARPGAARSRAWPTRPQASISAGARPASRPARARRAGSPHALRRPKRRISRRWIVDRPLALDQLLADRPGERLERLGPAAGPQPRAAADDRPEQRVALEGGVELGQVLVEAEREVHPLDAVLARLARGRLGPEPDRAARLPGAHDHGLVAVVEQPREHAVAAAQQAVAAGAGQPVGAGRDGRPARARTISASGGGRRRGTSGCPRPRCRARRRRAERRARRVELRGRRRTRTSVQASTPAMNPIVPDGHRRRQRRRRRGPLEHRAPGRLRQHRQRPDFGQRRGSRIGSGSGTAGETTPRLRSYTR